MEQVHIKFLGHACFQLSWNGVDIVIDPYLDDAVPGLAPVRAEADGVYCSHDHGDHCAAQNITLRRQLRPSPVTVEELETHHDDQGGSLRGMNTVHVFTFGDLKIAHLGDLGRMLTDQEARLLSGLDCMLLPVGGYYTIDGEMAKEIVAKTQPRVVIPMHYRGENFGYDVLGPVEDFTAGFEHVGYGGSEYALSKETPAQVLVLRPAMIKE